MILFSVNLRWKISNTEFLMDTNSTFLLFISKQVESIDFQSKLLDYVLSMVDF